MVAPIEPENTHSLQTALHPARWSYDVESAEVLRVACGSALPASRLRAPSSRLLALTFDTHDPGRPADFWAGVLGRVVIDDLCGALLPGSDTQVGLRFAPSGAERVVGSNRVHDI